MRNWESFIQIYSIVLSHLSALSDYWHDKRDVISMFENLIFRDNSSIQSKEGHWLYVFIDLLNCISNMFHWHSCIKIDFNMEGLGFEGDIQRELIFGSIKYFNIHLLHFKQRLTIVREGSHWSIVCKYVLPLYLLWLALVKDHFESLRLTEHGTSSFQQHF